MKKEMIMRGLLGFPLGMALGEAIAIAGSLVWGGGYYAPCNPQFVQAVGSESHAVALQAFLCGLIGSGRSDCDCGFARLGRGILCTMQSSVCASSGK